MASSFLHRMSVPGFFIAMILVTGILGIFRDVLFVGLVRVDVDERGVVEVAEPTRGAPAEVPKPQELDPEVEKERTRALVRAAMGEQEPLPVSPPAASRPLEPGLDPLLVVLSAAGGFTFFLFGGIGVWMLLGPRSKPPESPRSPDAPSFSDAEVERAMRDLDGRR